MQIATGLSVLLAVFFAITNELIYDLQRNATSHRNMSPFSKFSRCNLRQIPEGGYVLHMIV